MFTCLQKTKNLSNHLGIIESDDIAAVNLEIEKALNFSKKCGMLVSSVKKKYDIVSCDCSFTSYVCQVKNRCELDKGYYRCL